METVLLCFDYTVTHCIHICAFYSTCRIIMSGESLAALHLLPDGLTAKELKTEVLFNELYRVLYRNPTPIHFH